LVRYPKGRETEQRKKPIMVNQNQIWNGYHKDQVSEKHSTKINKIKLSTVSKNQETGSRSRGAELGGTSKTRTNWEVYKYRNGRKEQGLVISRKVRRAKRDREIVAARNWALRLEPERMKYKLGTSMELCWIETRVLCFFFVIFLWFYNFCYIML